METVRMQLPPAAVVPVARAGVAEVAAAPSQARAELAVEVDTVATTAPVARAGVAATGARQPAAKEATAAEVDRVSVLTTQADTVALGVMEEVPIVVQADAVDKGATERPGGPAARGGPGAL